ncbi:MAG: hypothetical protein HY741_19850 [Chloroflexi bacterium]|nr:hypothetical protein [Chloroflexota bacterium]
MMHNIAEGCGSGSNPKFIRFLKWRDALQATFNQKSILHQIASISRSKSDKMCTISQLKRND